MTWFKVDDGLTDHPKVRRLGRDKLPAIGVWVLVGAWVGRHDNEGFAPDEVVERFDARHRLAARLVAVGLWERGEHDGETGYRFHDWFDMQLSMAEIERKKEQNRERQRRYRLRRAGINPDDPDPVDTSLDDFDGHLDQGGHDAHQSRSQDGNALHDALVTLPRPDPTRPDPSSNGSDGGRTSGTERARAARRPPATNPDQIKLATLVVVPADAPPPERCRVHLSWPAGERVPNCGACGDARRDRERWDADRARAETDQRATQSAARAACTHCDEVGWLLEHPGGPPVEPARRCTHPTLEAVS